MESSLRLFRHALKTVQDIKAFPSSSSDSVFLRKLSDNELEKSTFKSIWQGFYWLRGDTKNLAAMQERVEKAAVIIIEAFASEIRVREQGDCWGLVGRSLALTNDLGERFLQLVYCCLSKNHSNSVAPLRQEIANRLQKQSKEYLNALAKHMGLLHAPWAEISCLMQSKPITALNKTLLSLFFQYLEHTYHTHPVDLICAVRPEVNDINEELKQYSRLAGWLKKREFKWPFKPSSSNFLDLPDFKSASFSSSIAKTNLSTSEQKPKLVHFEVFLDMAILFSPPKPTVFSPPEIAQLLPHLMGAYVYYQESIEQWRAKWPAESLDHLFTTDSRFLLFAQTIFEKLHENLMPDLHQLNNVLSQPSHKKEGSYIFFHKDKIVSLKQYNWITISFSELENFVWEFCQKNLKLYSSMMQASAQGICYQQFVGYLFDLVELQGGLKEDWIQLDTATLQWLYEKADLISCYFEQAARRGKSERAIKIAGIAAIKKSPHPFRMNLEELYQLAFEHDRT